MMALLRLWLTLLAMGALGPPGRGGIGVSGVTAQVESRWGQSSFLLTPNPSSPSFILVSGKTYVAGQTSASTPSSSTSLSLSLSSPITDLSSPPWTTLTSSPVVSYSSSFPLSSKSALIFGGDATGSSIEPIQTLSDSTYLVDFSPTSSTPTFTQQLVGWESEPSRRMIAFSVSATNGTMTRAWVFGGVKAEGSGRAYNELWEFRTHLDSEGNMMITGGDGWGMYGGSDGPTEMYDGQAVLVPSLQNPSSPPSIYFIGGVESSTSPALTPFSTIPIFTPSDSLASGTWSRITTTNAPPSRRGHVAVAVGGGKIWIQGGKSLDGQSVFGDSWMLDTTTGKWEEMISTGETRWGHSAVQVGSTVVLAFGYGPSQPASTALQVYAPGNDTYLDAYYPSFIVESPSSPISSSGPASDVEGSVPIAGGIAASTGVVATNSDATSNPVATLYPAVTQTSGVFSAGTGEQATSVGQQASQVAVTTTAADGSPTTIFNPAAGNTIGGNVITAGWSVPGGVAVSTVANAAPTSDPTNSSKGSSDTKTGSQSGTTNQHLVGGVVGGVLGALVLVVGAVLLVRRSRIQNEHYRKTSDESWHFINAGANESGTGGGGYPSYTVEKALPVGTPRGTNGRVRATFASMWKGAGGTGAASGRRFDMLRDEDAISEKWNMEEGRREGWMTFGDGDDFDESGRPTSPHFPFAAVPRREQPYSTLIDSDAGGDPALAPIAEWEEHDDDQDRDATSSHEPRSVDTHTTESTGPSTRSSNDTPSTPSSIPSSRSMGSTILYAFPAVAATATPIRRASLLSSDTPRMARSPSTNSETRRPLWWGRLSAKSSSSHETAFERIRDPAPPPNLDAITEVSPVITSRSNADEHGRYVSRDERHENRSASSELSLRTATSSQLEERVRGMDVIQRQTGSDVSSFGGTFGDHGEGRGDYGTLPTTEESPVLVSTPSSGAVVWRGDDAEATPVPTPQESQNPFADPLPILPPAAALSPPSSPRKLHGPRAAPLPAINTQNLPTSMSSPSLSALSGRPPTAGDVGVRALVQRFEQREASTSSPTSSFSSSPSLPNLSLSAHPVDGSGVERPSRIKIGHGFAKKPVLYVANPDRSDS